MGTRIVKIKHVKKNHIHLFHLPSYFCKMSNQAITITHAQSMVDNWIKSIGVNYFSELTNTAILMEEVGELARIMARKYGDQSFKENETDTDLADEMADVLWVLICLANQTGVDLTEAFIKNMEKKNMERCQKT